MSTGPVATSPVVAIIVVAAGSGTRLERNHPKAFVPVAGVSILERCLLGLPPVAQVIVVAPESQLAEARELLDGVRSMGPDRVVVGGVSRQESVAAGLAVIASGVEVVLVHDAARALTPSSVFERVIAEVEATGHGVIPVLAVSDTIKRVEGAHVRETVDRADLAAVQTPQGFRRADLERAYALADRDHTDDAALVALAGVEVVTVAGDALAFKITTPADLRRAEHEVGETMTTTRTGVGIDVHAYDASEPLWLGALYWPDEVGLSGHSDGDAMSHAICDALLSAAGLGDIGSRFGTDDPRFAGAHGEVFLRETVALVRGAGYRIGNVAVQLIANTPRLGARRSELESHLSELVGAPVSVSATTSDGLGFTGTGEGVAVIATALVS